MSRIVLRSFACLAFIATLPVSGNLYAGWFNSDDTIHIVDNKKSKAPAVKHAASIHITGYTDERTGLAPKKIGITTELVSGISGKELILDRDVAEVVGSSIRKRFDDAGFQILDDASALYELSGAIKELTYNVKARDEISLAIQTTLKETASGKVVWSGIVIEQGDRFAGISGNNKSDIASFLQSKLGIVTKKTFDAISTSLMASRPDLFNLAPGTKAIDGVTVLQATGISGTAPVASSGNKTAASNNGTLVLSTQPARSKVYLDGIYFGMSPLRTEVEVGIHEISVKSNGYKAATEKVSVRKGETTELELTLER